MASADACSPINVSVNNVENFNRLVTIALINIHRIILEFGDDKKKAEKRAGGKLKEETKEEKKQKKEEDNLEENKELINQKFQEIMLVNPLPIADEEPAGLQKKNQVQIFLQFYEQVKRIYFSVEVNLGEVCQYCKKFFDLLANPNNVDKSNPPNFFNIYKGIFQSLLYANDRTDPNDEVTVCKNALFYNFN